MKSRFLHVILLLCLAVLLAACRPVTREAATAAEPAAAAPSVPGELSWDASVEDQIASAMSAAPLALSQNATIMGHIPPGGTQAPVLREGTNGWTCVPDYPGSPGTSPECFEETWQTFWSVATVENKPEMQSIGLDIMLQGGTEASTTDIDVVEPPPGEDWIFTPPHVMMVVPWELDPDLITTDHTSGYPYIMWEGTPLEHVMMPVVPAVSPSNGPLTADASAEEQIENMRSAAPAAVVDNATLMGYPSEEGGDMVVLQEGANGWTCYPDRLVSPGNDPSCNDAIMEEGFNTGATRDVTHLGLSYMLAGGSDECNDDPTCAGPADPNDWVTTPPHVMLMAPGGFDAAIFTTDHSSGYPYIMFDDSDYEHLMVPVADMAAHAETNE